MDTLCTIRAPHAIQAALSRSKCFVYNRHTWLPNCSCSAHELQRSAGDGFVRVLIIEDDIFLLTAYRIVLQDQGHQICVAQDGETGVALAEKLAPDAILLDIVLPGMSGVDVLRRLKASVRSASIPVLVFSNQCSEREITQIMGLGAVAHMQKNSTNLQELSIRLSVAAR
jgi:phosphoserine phosphatase RsbU/P